MTDKNLPGNDETDNHEGLSRLASQEDLREYYRSFLIRAYGKVALGAAKARLGVSGYATEWFPGGCDFRKGDGAEGIDPTEVGILANQLPEETVYFLETCLVALKNRNRGDLSWALCRIGDAVTAIVTAGNHDDLGRGLTALELVATQEDVRGPGGVGTSEAVAGLLKAGLKAVEMKNDTVLAKIADSLATVSSEGCGEEITRQLNSSAKEAEEVLKTRRAEKDEDPEEQSYSDTDEVEVRGILDAISRIRSELRKRSAGGPRSD